MTLFYNVVGFILHYSKSEGLILMNAFVFQSKGMATNFPCKPSFFVSSKVLFPCSLSVSLTKIIRGGRLS